MGHQREHQKALGPAVLARLGNSDQSHSQFPLNFPAHRETCYSTDSPCNRKLLPRRPWASERDAVRENNAGLSKECGAAAVVPVDVTTLRSCPRSPFHDSNRAVETGGATRKVYEVPRRAVCVRKKKAGGFRSCATPADRDSCVRLGVRMNAARPPPQCPAFKYVLACPCKPTRFRAPLRARCAYVPVAFPI
jgi:hypothetical protein